MIRRTLCVFAVALAGCPAPPGPAPAPAPAPPAERSFAGSFTDGTLGLELRQSDDGLEGTFHVNAKDFPAAGRVEGGRLSASFSVAEKTYPFAATWDGEALVVTCDGKTYRLLPGPMPQPKPEPRAMTAEADSGTRDDALVGNWSRAKDVDAKSQVTLELRDDGTYVYGHSRAVSDGSGKTTRKASGQLVGGRWRTGEGTILTSATGEAPWIVFASYDAGDDRVMLTFEGQDPEVWRRN